MADNFWVRASEGAAILLVGGWFGWVSHTLVHNGESIVQIIQRFDDYERAETQALQGLREDIRRLHESLGVGFRARVQSIRWEACEGQCCAGLGG